MRFSKVGILLFFDPLRCHSPDQPMSQRRRGRYQVCRRIAPQKLDEIEMGFQTIGSSMSGIGNGP